MLSYVKESFQAVGEFQSRLILTAFYVFVVPIFALLARLQGDALGLNGYKQVSSWIHRPKAEHTLAEAQRQG
ncbi:hypothetical protein IV102_08510 [bacterium]|nr:hypothetical protein [bacterium]